ncbi:MAG: ZIP family metal transporter [Glycocaulis sp.]
MSPLLLTLVFALLAAGVVIATLAGLRFAAGFTRAHSPLMAAFAAGLLLTIAVLHLIPEAMEGSRFALWMVAAGLAAGFLLQRTVRRFAGDADKAVAMAPVFAIAIHASLDGLTYTIAFASDSFSGLAAGAGLLLHKPADAAVCFILLQRAGLSDSRAMLWSLAAAGLSTLLFAAVTAPFAGALSPALVASLLGLAAGVMIHVSAAHLFSHARSGGLRRAVPMVVLGAVAATGLTAAHRAGHDHHHHHHHDHEHHHHSHDELARLSPHFGPVGGPSSNRQRAD